MSSTNKESFISSFSICVHFISICLIALSKTSSTMLKMSSERGHPFLVFDLSEKALSFSPLIMVLAIRFCKYSLFS